VTGHRLVPLERGHLPDVAELVVRAGDADRLPYVESLEELEEMFDEPHFDPASDGRVVVSAGQVTAWGRIWHRPSGEREERAYLFGTVDPALRGRGIGTALFAWQVERATTVIRATPGDLPRRLRTDAYDWLEADHGLYARFGFEPVRWMEELRRPLTDLPEPPAVSGIAVIRWDPARAEAARLVKNTAFRDHWGSTPTDAESWQVWLSGHGTRQDMSVMAIDADGRLVGYALNEHLPHDELRTGRKDGWIGNLGVVREWRRRGVGAALVVASLAAFAGSGMTHAMLGVDADNPTGAAGLYRRLGFETVSRSITRQRTV
jgi:mycothiol synthase